MNAQQASVSESPAGFYRWYESRRRPVEGSCDQRFVIDHDELVSLSPYSMPPSVEARLRRLVCAPLKILETWFAIPILGSHASLKVGLFR